MSNGAELRKRLLRFLVRGTSARLEHLDAAGYLTAAVSDGEPGSAWSPLAQGALYPLAALYETPHSENPFFDDERIAEAVFSAGDALYSELGADGTLPLPPRTPFAPHAGTTLEPAPLQQDALLPWTLLHWLQAWMLLSADTDAVRTDAWRRGLETACDAVVAGLRRNKHTPVAAWSALTAAKAGAVFEKELHREAAEEYMRALAEAQGRDGSWPAWTVAGLFSGLHALALYYETTRDVWVLPALEKARCRALKETAGKPESRKAEPPPAEFFFSALAPFVAAPLGENEESDRLLEATLKRLENQAGDADADFLAAGDCLLFCRVVEEPSTVNHTKEK